MTGKTCPYCAGTSSSAVRSGLQHSRNDFSAKPHYTDMEIDAYTLYVVASDSANSLSSKTFQSHSGSLVGVQYSNSEDKAMIDLRSLSEKVSNQSPAALTMLETLALGVKIQ